MSESRLTNPALHAIETADLPVDGRELPLQTRRRDTFGRFALVGADLAAVAGSLFIVTLLPFSDPRFTLWAAVFLPAWVLLAKMAGLYDRDQFVLHKTTLDEAPVLLAVAAILSLGIEGVQSIQYTGIPTLPYCVVLTAALIVARGAARFLTVRALPNE